MPGLPGKDDGRAEMRQFVLDSEAVTALAARTRRAAGILAVMSCEGVWPPVVPTAVLVECLSGRPGEDAMTNRFLKTCLVDGQLPTAVARRAAALRRAAGRGSAVDAIVVAKAEPGGVVLTGDTEDVGALAANATGVVMMRV